MLRNSGHGLNSELLAGIWTANKEKFIIQMFVIYMFAIQIPTVHWLFVFVGIWTQLKLTTNIRSCLVEWG